MSGFGVVLGLSGLVLFVVALIALFRPFKRVIRSRGGATIAMAASMGLVVVGLGLIGAANPTVTSDIGEAATTGDVSAILDDPTSPEQITVEPGIQKVDQSTVLTVDPEAAAGRFDITVLSNDDGSHTLWSRAYVAPTDMAVMVDQSLIAAQTLLEWCRTGGSTDCRKAKDAYLWVERVGPDRGSLGFLFAPGDWSSAVSSPEEAGDRAELLPGDQFGRDGLGVWCNMRREQPEGFCQRVRILIAPQT